MKTKGNFLRSASLKAEQCARIGRLRSLRSRFDQEANITYLSRILKRLPPMVAEQSTTSEMLLGNVPFNNLPRRNHFFYGRRAELAEVDHLFESSGGFRQTQVAVHGFPGSGKSELALEYVHQKYEEGSYEVVLWICADTEVKLCESVGSITRGLGLLSDRCGYGVESQQAVLLQWLEKTARRSEISFPIQITILTLRSCRWEKTHKMADSFRQCIRPFYTRRLLASCFPRLGNSHMPQP